jgi:2-polyprenyl-3-methyl-5-hydroxy-6-metoxy-1,4-benzoquinol methylase
MDKKDIFSKDYFFGCKNSNYFNYNVYDKDQYWSFIIKQLKKVKDRKRILDVGCAFGFFLKRAANLFKEIHGIDISEFAIRQAERKVSEGNFIISDIEEIKELPYPDDYFNVITAFDVLEHTSSIKESLGKIIPKIKKNGQIFISVPLKDTLIGYVFNLLDKDVTHISVLKRKELFLIIEELGLRIVKKKYFLNAGFYRVLGIPVCMELVLQKIDKNI